MKRGRKRLVFAAVLFVSILLTGCKGSKYGEAKKLYDSKEYAKAKEVYEELADYKDSADMIKACDYGIARDLYDSGNYEDAKAAFAALGEYEDSADMIDACIYGEAVGLFEEGKYPEAQKRFSGISSFKDSGDYILKCVLGQADKEMEKGDYAEAARLLSDEYTSSKSTDAADKLCVCLENILSEGDADTAEPYVKQLAEYQGAEKVENIYKFIQMEKLYEGGYLNTALEGYQKLPEDFAYNGVSAKDRIDAINRHPDFLAVCGKWMMSPNSTENVVSIQQDHVRTGLWDGWDFEVDGGEGYTDICCKINEDDSVHLFGTVFFTHATSYSSLSANVKFKDATLPFEYTGNSMPSTINVGEIGTLTYAGDGFKYEYSIVDTTTSLNFKYTASGTIKYDNLSEKH